MKKASFYDMPTGRIGIAEADGAIANVFFGHTVRPEAYETEETPLIRRAAEQLFEYFEGRRRAFDLPLQPIGTRFERAVWDTLLTIPYGETRTYGQVAMRIGNPKACRAVGRANGRNPISIFIPCHRVIGAGGALTGYAGGVEMKERLLGMEAAKQPTTSGRSQRE
ncbi:MAG: methylated-DNA--[protein]-cysteine S-methyltransferase [Firmicutes bacterium]|nr:methylated-DNA--[protein]-cysteine S-methyltransferase [Bacillota bacterium]